MSTRVEKQDRKAKQAIFTRRKATLLSKANELAQLCNVDVYLVVRGQRKYHTYSSTTRTDLWPPNPQMIVSQDTSSLSSILIILG